MLAEALSPSAKGEPSKYAAETNCAGGYLVAITVNCSSEAVAVDPTIPRLDSLVSRLKFLQRPLKEAVYILKRLQKKAIFVGLCESFLSRRFEDRGRSAEST